MQIIFSPYHANHSYGLKVLKVVMSSTLYSFIIFSGYHTIHTELSTNQNSTDLFFFQFYNKITKRKPPFFFVWGLIILYFQFSSWQLEYISCKYFTLFLVLRRYLWPYSFLWCNQGELQKKKEEKKDLISTT